MACSEAFAHAELAAQEAGLKLRYIRAIKMVDNYLPIFKMQEQIDTLPKKDVEGQIEAMLRELRDRRETPVKITAMTKLQMSAISKRLAGPILRKDTAQSYIVNDACIRCGVCAKVCPANNITATDRVQFRITARSAMPVCTTVRRTPSI